MENIKEPKRRFKGYNEAWVQRKLGDIAEIRTGPFGSVLHAEDYVSNGTPIVTTEHFKSGELPIAKEDLPQVSDADYKRLNSYKLESGDIVFSRVGSVDVNALVGNDQNGWLFSGRVLRVRPQGAFDGWYLHYLLDTKSVKDDIISRAVGQTMPSINTEILNGTGIKMSNLVDEQHKIGEFFSNLDNLITLHQRKYEKLRSLKKAYLSEMFPLPGEKRPRRRFAGFTGDWQQRKFEEFCSIVTKQTGFDYTATIKKSLVTEASEDTLPYLQTKNFEGISISYDTDYFIPKSVAKEFPKINLDEKCLLFSIVGASVGNIGLFPGDIHCFLSGAICVSKLNDKDDADYLYHYMCSENGQSQIRTCTKGGAQATITIEDIREFGVVLPSEKERRKIGRFLSSLDGIITLHQRKLAKLQALKKAYLTEMFP